MQASLNPCLQIPSGPVPRRGYVDETSHRAAGEVHGPRMWLRECCIVLLEPRAYHKVLINDPTAHVTFHHERESAEHPLLLERVGPAHEGTNSFCQSFVKRHESPASCASLRSKIQ